MAQAVQSTIVDLTGEDGNDDSIARANAACEKAFAAASRLTNHFESMNTPNRIAHQSPNGNADLTKKHSLSATVPKRRVLPWVGTLPNPVKPETNGLKKDEKNDAIPRPKSSTSSIGVSTPQSALGAVASRPARSPSMSQRTDGKKQQPKETLSGTPRTDNLFTIRTPRSAAISAKQNIAEACSELEEWVNKDPNIIPQQAGFNSPRRQGRPNDDLEEWSPSPTATNKEEERNGLGRMITNSPTPELSHTRGILSSLGTKKRRFSGSSQSRGSPLKVARRDEEPSAHHHSTPLNSAEPANRKLVHDGSGSNPPAGVVPSCVYPAIKAAKAEYKQSLTEDDLTGIAKSVSQLLRRHEPKSPALKRGERITDEIDYQRYCGARSRDILSGECKLPSKPTDGADFEIRVDNLS